MAPPRTEFLSVAEAAEKLGAKPWEVIRLTEAGRIDSVVLVNAASLARYVEENPR